MSHPDGLARNRATGAFERRVAAALGAHLDPAMPLVVACSGGPDSTAALIATARAAEGRAATVVAATFDHRIRSEDEALEDRAYVERVSERLGVRCAAGSAREASGAGNSEEAAREARYRWLAAVCGELRAAACVTGHTLDDQAETVLLRLTRGSGLEGASGMAADAPWPVACETDASAPLPRVLRPMLRVGRTEVLAYLEALGVSELELWPREDPSNVDRGYARNRVRHDALPALRTVNPRAVEALARFAEIARRDAAALRAWAEEVAAGLLHVEGPVARLDRRALRALPEGLAVRVVRIAAARVGLSIEAEQALAVLESAGRRGARVDLRGGSSTTDDRTVWIERRERAGA